MFSFRLKYILHKGNSLINLFYLSYKLKFPVIIYQTTFSTGFWYFALFYDCPFSYGLVSLVIALAFKCYFSCHYFLCTLQAVKFRDFFRSIIFLFYLSINTLRVIWDCTRNGSNWFSRVTFIGHKQTNHQRSNKPNMLNYFTCRSWAATAVPSLNKPGRDKQINR